jgi:dolichyl-phosphate beta-glucosyltransferase
VDDGSDDATAAVAERQSVRVLRNSGNRGKGYSVRQGMLKAQGDWVLFSDADLSSPIEELDTLWEAVRKSGAPIAFGSRALDRSLIGVRQSLIRENIGRIFNLLVHLIAGLPFWDTQCGFKLFEAAAAREIFRRQQLNGFGFDVETLFIARRLGYRAVEVPVHWNHSEGTKVSTFRGLDAFVDLLRIRWHQLRGRYTTRERSKS